MAFSHARQNSQIKLSAKEMFEISQEISRDFSPIISNTIPEFVLPEKRPPANYSPASANDRKPGRFSALSKLPLTSHVKISQQELLEISREITRKFAPKYSLRTPDGKSRYPLSAQELLMVGDEISREFAPNLTDGHPELVLLPIDPWHLHVYWQLGRHEAETGRPTEPEQPLLLRIYPELVEPVAELEPPVCFDVAVDGLQGRQKVELPASFGANRFSAVIGKIDSDQGFTVYHRSNIVHVPRSSRGEFRNLGNRKAPGGLPFLLKHASGLGK